MIEFDDLKRDQEEVFGKDGVQSATEMFASSSFRFLLKEFGKGMGVTLLLSAIAFTVKFIIGAFGRTIDIN